MWCKCVVSQRVSGLSRKKWCDQNDINFNTLAYWIGRFNKKLEKSEHTETKWATVTYDSKPIKLVSDKLSVSS